MVMTLSVAETTGSM